VLNVASLATKDIRKHVRTLAETIGAPAFLWKIFEMSGTRGGQETAFALLGYGASLAIVGYTADRVEIPLSNLMAFEATARGNWGADPLVYPELLQWIGARRLTVKPFVEQHPLHDINAVFDAARDGRLLKRAVLVPG
jgi:6-hydroxycyclohex-1-ene-1-carbonyl-CoA dehydrogenase